MTMNIEWVDELPPAKLSIRQSQYEQFAQALKANPGRWAKWPRVYANPASAYAIAMSIRKGDQRAPGPFKHGTWEAEVREKVLYVRWPGE